MPRHLRNRSLSDDPFSVVTSPPRDESPSTRQQRLQEEQRAKDRSDQIDEQIKREREALQQAQPFQRRLLLLGQAESGKTTTLKQFQLMQSASAFSAQLNSYRALIYLNVLNTVRRILDAVALPDDPETALSDSSSSSSYSSNRQYPPHLTTLALRLRPLLHIHSLLERQLKGPAESSGLPAPPQSHASRWLRRTGSGVSSSDERNELTVHAWTSWSDRFAAGARPGSTESITMDWNARDDPGRIFAACAEDLLALWEDVTVQEALTRQRLSIRESPGLLSASKNTISGSSGVQTLASSGESVKSILSYCMRAYVMSLATAPISPFDQTLAEDPRMNRVKDSLLLWQDICRNKVLEKVPIVLFLNKCDLLKAKLAAGVQFRKYMTSYKGPNEKEPVAEFLRLKFDEVYRASCSPKKRTLYIHQTSVVGASMLSLHISPNRQSTFGRFPDNAKNYRKRYVSLVPQVREQIMREALAAVGLY
ncbi:hypothetical protein FRC10_000185 [Ceratobasidium sp. 414]|nr:hypothetical protein FRC10_000185 [Ceratobasidium sp. 414]